MVFTINGHHVELDCVDGNGYDIYIDNSDDPINLGDVAYFDNEPTWHDVDKWLMNNCIKAWI